MLRPEKQIQNEIVALQETKPRIPEFNGFRDSNHEAIDAQVKVLSDRLSYADLVKEYGGKVDDMETLEAAKYARDWMNSEPVWSPSSEWLNRYAGRLVT